MKKKLILIGMLATLSSIVLAAGALAPVTHNGTGGLTWTNTGTSPAYIERVDVRCSTINTATVTVVNFAGITNTLASAESTNGIVEYAPATPNVYVIKGGTLTVAVTGAATTNKVAVYPFAK